MKFIVDTHNSENSKAMIEMILENELATPISVKEVEPINEKEVNEYVQGFWDDDLEIFEENPQKDMIMWVAKRLYESGIKLGYCLATK